MNALLIALLLAVQQPADVGQRIDAATLLVDAGRVDEGIAALKQIVADHPENESAKYELALAYMGKGDAENCRKILEPLADVATKRVLILALLGSCFDELGQRDKAIETYHRGLALSPTDSGLTFNLAVTLAQQGKLNEARELLKTDTRANPWHASGHLVLAKIFETQSYRVPAVFSYLHFLALEPSPRANDAATHLRQLLDLGVKTGKKETNITIDPDAPKNEGDYTPVAMALAIASAGRTLPEYAKLSEFERVRRQVASAVEMFVDLSADHDDYTSAVHRPFFAAMQKEKLGDTFAAIAVTPLKLKGTDEWVTKHGADIARYSAWIAPQQKRPPVQAPAK